jgi:hypothetical protein
MFAVFDITNIAPVFSINNTGTAEASNKAKEDLKCYPNANVVFELSYALARKRPDQILLVKRNRADDFLYDRVPFDFEHNRRIEYTDSSKITKTLRNILVDYFRRVNYIKID